MCARERACVHAHAYGAKSFIQGCIIVCFLLLLALFRKQGHFCNNRKVFWEVKLAGFEHIFDMLTESLTGTIIEQVHLVSEHIWCDDYLVRSFYLKNLQTNETRTVTQFHFLTWPHLSVPPSMKALLDFRRSVCCVFPRHVLFFPHTHACFLHG